MNQVGNVGYQGGNVGNRDGNAGNQGGNARNGKVYKIQFSFFPEIEKKREIRIVMNVII